jgi:hypothetical protein
MIKIIPRPILSLIVISINLSLCFSISSPNTSVAIYNQENFSIEKPLISKWENKVEVLSLSNSDDKILIVHHGGILASIAEQDGHIIWQVNIGGDVIMPPLIDKSFCFVHTVNPNQQTNKTYHLQAIDINTGITKWRIQLPKQISKAFNSTPYLFVLLNDQTLLKLNKLSGESIRAFDFSKINGQTNYFDDKLIVTTSKKTLFTTNSEDNRVLWHFSLTNEIVSEIVSANNSFVFATKEGYFYSLDKTSGKLIWKKKIAKNAISIIPTENGLLITNTENNMYFCTFQGKIKWKRLLDGKFSNNLLIQHSSVLLFPVGSNSGFVLSLKNGKPLNRIRIEDLNFVIAPPVATSKILIIQTQRGLIAYSNN